MLTQIEIITSSLDVSPFSFDDGTLATDPIQVHNITGLGPVNSDVNTTEYGSIDGELFTGVHTGKRNIVLTVGLNPDWVNSSYESLRRILYSYFSTGSSVILKFTTTEIDEVYIDGYVESFDANQFDKDPEAQISIICPKPYFQATKASIIPGITTAFSDNSSTPIFYEGDAPVGFVVDIQMQDENSSLSSQEIRIINDRPSSVLFSAKATVDDNNFVRISTVVRDKYYLQMPLPSGDGVDSFSKVVPGSVWFPLQKGTNNLQVQSANPGQSWNLQYYPLYGGL